LQSWAVDNWSATFSALVDFKSVDYSLFAVKEPLQKTIITCLIEVVVISLPEMHAISFAK